jgi:hypothetical protein
MKKDFKIEMRCGNEPTDAQGEMIDDNQFLLKANGGMFDGFICDFDGRRLHAFIDGGKKSAKNKFGLSEIVTITPK